MPPQAAGPKSRAQSSKVVPAIPHALAPRPKAKPEALATPVISSDTVEPNVIPSSSGAEDSTEASLPDAPNAGPEQQQQQQQHLTTNGEAIISASTSEKSIATTSQSTPPAPAPRKAHGGEPANTKDQVSGLGEHASRNAPVTHAVVALPPPFYPASQQSNPSPTVSTSAQPDRPAAIAAMHHRNNSNLVFGGHRDSASPSPGPGIMPGAPFAGPLPGPPFPNHSPSSPVFMSNGHAHHVSEPFAPVYSPPYFPGNGNGAFGRDYYPGPYAQGRPFMPNGRGPPVRRDFGASPGLPPPRPVPGPTTQAPPGMLQPSDPSPAEALDLTRYLRSQFGNREHADHVVVISHSSHKLSPGTFALHGLMLARSPKLASLMSMGQSAAMSYPKTLHVVISDRFIDLDDVVTRGLLHLYGDALLDLGSIPGMLAASGFPPNPYLQLRAALAYAALGHFLQMDAIIIRGLDMAASLLKWQNIGLALAFALEGGLGAAWSEGLEDKASASSVDEASSPASAPVYGIYSDRMLHAATAFIINNFPADFELAAGVPQLPETPRLPTAAEPRHARSGSRLSQIRFGDMTVEERGPEYLILSGVLLSLPFAILKHVLEQPSLVSRLGATRVREVMRKTIEEREQRRQRVAAQSSMPLPVPESSQDERLWHSVRWEERVEEMATPGSESCGLQLSRQCLTMRHEADKGTDEGATSPNIFA